MDIEEIDFSEAFISAFKNMGGAAFECNCGREHIDIPYLEGQNEDNGDSKAEIEEEMDGYYTRAETDDKLVLRYDGESLEVMSIAGHEFVYGCECEEWKRYMSFIVAYRYHIKDFLLEMAFEVEKASEQEQIMKKLKHVNMG